MRKFIVPFLLILLLFAIPVVAQEGLNLTDELRLGTGGAVATATTVPFSPSDISGLILWLDADDSTTLFQDLAMTIPAVLDSDVVGGWADKSGNANHATQATTARKPLLKLVIQNGRDVVRFDGTDDFLSLAVVLLSISDAAQPYTCFVVVKTADTAGAFIGQYVGVDNNRFGFGSGISPGDGKLRYWKADAISIADSQTTISDGNAHIAEFKKISSGANQTTLYRDGNLVATGTDYRAFSNDITTFGAISAGSAPLSGDLDEILIYNSALSDSDRGDVESYLSAKWGITLASVPRDCYYALSPGDYLAFAFGAMERRYSTGMEVAR